MEQNIWKLWTILLGHRINHCADMERERMINIPFSIICNIIQKMKVSEETGAIMGCITQEENL